MSEQFDSVSELKNLRIDPLLPLYVSQKIFLVVITPTVFAFINFLKFISFIQFFFIPILKVVNIINLLVLGIKLEISDSLINGLIVLWISNINIHFAMNLYLILL